MTAYTVLLLAVAAERVAELVVSQRHLRWARERGALESGQGHYPAMVVLHVALLVGCLVEVHTLDRPFLAWLGGRCWSSSPPLRRCGGGASARWVRSGTPGSWSCPVCPLVRTGPYRWLRHPNYVAVVAEGVALPLVHSAWLTALVFTVLNAWLLAVRIRCENRVLDGVRPAHPAGSAR